MPRRRSERHRGEPVGKSGAGPRARGPGGGAREVRGLDGWPGEGLLPKCPTGIEGLDQITGGGIPLGRPTLVCGGAGCGKTLLAMEFLARGAREFGDPGVFVSFEENAKELAANVASLGFDLEGLTKKKLFAIDHIQVERSEIHETGEYDLEGLFVRLAYTIDSIGAKRIALDTIESLFSGLANHAILRAELRRLFRWIKDKGLTAVITGERGQGQLTRQGLEEYVSDCVILLDNRVTEQITTRRLRVVKYRGSAHGTNEYPFLIDREGFAVIPITSLGLKHEMSTERVSTGVPSLDAMLSGGIYRGSSVLLSGTAGTGKSSLASHFAAAACGRGERVLYFAFEESAPQIVRNMRSIGLDMEKHIRSGLLSIHSERPTAFGLEMHLTMMHRAISDTVPGAVVFDPLSSLVRAGSYDDAVTMVMRLIDYLKSHNITGMFTNLTHGGDNLESTELSVSSLMDAWLVLRDVEAGGERNRLLHLIKCRGTGHSNQVREFLLTSRGIELREPYLGPGGVLTGSARLVQEASDQAQELARREETAARKEELERRESALEAQLAAIQAELRAGRTELARLEVQERGRLALADATRSALAQSRKASSREGGRESGRESGREKGRENGSVGGRAGQKSTGGSR